MNKVVGLLYLLTLYQEGCVAMTVPIVGCIIDGRHFQPGEEISRGTEGSWCHGSICSGNGQVIAWDGMCDTDVSTWPNIRQPSTTQPEPFTTPQQPGCYTGKRWIQPGEITLEVQDEIYCYALYCNTDGTLDKWEYPHC